MKRSAAEVLLGFCDAQDVKADEILNRIERMKGHLNAGATAFTVKISNVRSVLITGDTIDARLADDQPGLERTASEIIEAHYKKETERAERFVAYARQMRNEVNFAAGL